MACLSLLGATGCDLADKDIGDETMGGSGEPGDDCEPGDEVPAADGCNTCYCEDDGTLTCSAIGCGTGPEPQCEPGSSVPADDGCNTCECNDDGTVGACTEEACDPVDIDPFDGPAVSACQPDTPFDGLVINDVTLDGDTLTVDVAYSGCGPGHPLGGCWDGNFDESAPVQTGLSIAHDNLGEVCEAFPSDSVDIDLTPMRDAYLESYGGDGGEIDISIPGWDILVLYSF